LSGEPKTLVCEKAARRRLLSNSLHHQSILRRPRRRQIAS
jgi:hypothetical protein